MKIIVTTLVCKSKTLFFSFMFLTVFITLPSVPKYAISVEIIWMEYLYFCLEYFYIGTYIMRIHISIVYTLFVLSSYTLNYLQDLHKFSMSYFKRVLLERHFITHFNITYIFMWA